MAGIALVAVIAIAAGFNIHATWDVRRDVAERGESSEKFAQARQDELRQLVKSAVGGGAPAVKAIADIRDLLRPGNPKIDDIPAEKLPKLVQRIVEDLQRSGARPEDFSGAVELST